jgi:hypothetical protein
MGAENGNSLAVFFPRDLAICLSLLLPYALIFRFGRSSELCRWILGAILFAIAGLLVPPCLFLLFVLFAGPLGLVVAVVFGCLIAAAWWGPWLLGRRLAA